MESNKKNKQKDSAQEDLEDEIADEEESSSDDETEIAIKHIGKKIGEPKGNLKRREEWFQKRSGKR